MEGLASTLRKAFLSAHLSQNSLHTSAAASAGGGAIRTLKEALAAWTRSSKPVEQPSSSEQEPISPSLTDALDQSEATERSPDSLHTPGQPVTTAAAKAESAAAQDPAQRLTSPEYGYAALSGFKADNMHPGALDFGASLPRLHPSKRFMPGQRYNPQDLNPYAVSSEPTRRKGRPAGDRLTAHDAESLTDFKNVAFLSNYLTPDGRLMPRKQTRLPQRQHRNIMQAIKLARNMALMAGETRLDKLHLARIRREESFQVAMQEPLTPAPTPTSLSSQ